MLKIDAVAAHVDDVARRIAAELPEESDLATVATRVGRAAEQARRVAASTRSLISPHRLPVYFLAAALVGLLTWVYWSFFRVPTLTLALPERDAVFVREALAGKSRVNVIPKDVPGSRESAQMVADGKVDIAYVQGPIPIPARLSRIPIANRDLLLWLVRDGRGGLASVKKILTSVEGEASHSAARAIFALLHREVEYVHAWPRLTDGSEYAIPDDVDAALVTKDPSDERTLNAIDRLVRAGFRPANLDLGARANRLAAFIPTTIVPGTLNPDPPIPAEPIRAYRISSYLVARQGLAPRLLASTAKLVGDGPADAVAPKLDTSEAATLLQGVDALLSIVVNIVLAFLALLGLDAWLYRRPLFELSALVSTINLLQSNQEVLRVGEAARARSMSVLMICSDLLSLVSAVNAYYTQENNSLLFNDLSVMIHQRCDALKLNIQLKLLEAVSEGRAGDGGAIKSTAA